MNLRAVLPSKPNDRAGKLQGVEGARGVAAALVVFVHASDMLSPTKYFGTLPFDGAFRFAHAGVDFFFVLSGFIIYHIHRQDIGIPSRAAAYAWKRFARIYPTYWAVLAGFGLIVLYSPEKDVTATSAGNILASVFLLPRMQDPIVRVAWTLRHEMMFYILFGVLLLNRSIGRMVLGLWAAVIGWNIVVFTATGTPYFQGMANYLPFRVFNIEFFFGIGVALLLGRGPAWRPRMLLALGVLIFFSDGMFESFGPHLPIEWPPRQLTYALGAAFALYGLVGAERAGTLRVPRALFEMGSASYSIYLTHLTAIMILQQMLLSVRHFVPLSLDVSFIVISAIAILGGVVFSRLVEQPLLRWLRRRPPRVVVPA